VISKARRIFERAGAVVASLAIFGCVLIVGLINLVQPISAQPSFPQASPSSQKAPAGNATLRIIVVVSPEEAQHILERLQRGEDFGAMAKQKSIDSTADEGGFMGKLVPSLLRPELREALRGVGPGQISAIVRTPLGYAVLKVEVGAGAETTAGAGKSAEAQAALGAGGGAAANLGGTPGTTATGSVKYTFNLGGFGEATVGLARFDKPARWNEDPRKICEIRKDSLAAEMDPLENFLAPANKRVLASERPIDVMNAHFTLGEMNSYQGKMGAAIEQYQAAYRIAVSQVPSGTLQMNEALGIAYLHKSEMENGVYRTPGERCLLPMRPGNAYAKTGDSEKAVEYFLKYLEQKPSELEVRWLLNVAYMTLGTYPGKVPPQYVIPPSAFASAENVGRFVDVAPQAGLDVFAMAGGVAVDDFENNGRLDIVTSTLDSCGPMHFFHNNGDGTFTDRAAKAGLADQLGGLNLIQADYNNDGCTDILLLRGAWESAQRRSLLRNNCDGTFTDVTAGSGLGTPTSSQAAVWVDINNDGLLDLFVGNEDRPAELFLNKGNGKFEDISKAAGIDRVMFSKGVAAADYDNDGWPDLYISNLNGTNVLYHNNHDNTFTEVAKQAGVPGSGHGFATWFFDYDNDGWPDLFVTSYFVSVDETARTYLGLPHNATTLKLYQNMKDGTFRDVTTEVGLDKVFMPMGANFGDIDNDGFLDIYMGTGNPSYGSLVPNVLLRNHEGKYFVDVTASSGTGELHKGHAVAFADLDNDGDEDIITSIGGATPGDSHAMRVFENPGNGNDWINLKLVGVKTNRSAIGARIKVTVENKGRGSRSIYRTVGSGGSFGASPLQQHVGLGESAKIVDLEIWWPTSNTRQHFSEVDKNQFLEIKEFAQDYTKLERRSYRLGGGNRDAAASKTAEQAPVPANSR
jgi:tetratricopeptide (TPR) repeat protein